MKLSQTDHKIKICNFLNVVIANRNLYRDGKRYINAHFGGYSNLKGQICVTEICTENHVAFEQGQFTDCNGTPVVISGYSSINPPIPA